MLWEPGLARFQEEGCSRSGNQVLRVRFCQSKYTFPFFDFSLTFNLASFQDFLLNLSCWLSRTLTLYRCMKPPFLPRDPYSACVYIYIIFIDISHSGPSESRKPPQDGET